MIAFLVQEEDGTSNLTLEEEDGSLVFDEEVTPVIINVDLQIS